MIYYYNPDIQNEYGKNAYFLYNVNEKNRSECTLKND